MNPRDVDLIDLGRWVIRARRVGLDAAALVEGVDVILAGGLPTIGWWRRHLSAGRGAVQS